MNLIAGVVLRSGRATHSLGFLRRTLGVPATGWSAISVSGFSAYVRFHLARLPLSTGRSSTVHVNLASPAGEACHRITIRSPGRTGWRNFAELNPARTDGPAIGRRDRRCDHVEQGRPGNHRVAREVTGGSRMVLLGRGVPSLWTRSGAYSPDGGSSRSRASASRVSLPVALRGRVSTKTERPRHERRVDPLAQPRHHRLRRSDPAPPRRPSGGSCPRSHPRPA